MIRSSAVGLAVLVSIVSVAPMHGQSPARYRDFQLGGSLASVSTLTGSAATDAKTLHSRPAVLQELQWRRPYRSSETREDPVERIAFSFYNDQLFRLVIDYDRGRTEGMTDADMIDGISRMYGPAAKTPVKASRAPLAALVLESGTRVAAWGDGEYSAVLYRSDFLSSGFRLIVTSVRLEALAVASEAEAVRLDEQNAPQRELARQKKEADDEHAAKDKARVSNKAAFRP